MTRRRTLERVCAVTARVAIAVACLVSLPAAGGAQPSFTCGNLIVGPHDATALAAGLFCPASCGVRDMNGDGILSAADISATVVAVRACQAPARDGRLSTAPGDDPQHYEVANRFGSTTPDADGRFTLGSSDNAPTLTYAVSDTGVAYAALSFGEQTTLKVDALSTARAFVALNPLLIPGNPDEHRKIWDLIRASDAVGALADAIAAAYAAGRDLEEDSDVADRLDEVVVGLLSQIAARGVGLSGVSIPPGECQGGSTTIEVCNYDMVNLTLASSSGASLRVTPASSGFLGLRTNVDWVARVVELDAARVPSAGGRYLFSPRTIDQYITPGGFDRPVVIRGEIAAGWFRFVVDPVATFSAQLAGLLLPRGESGVLLPRQGLYAVVAVSGSWANDIDEYLDVLNSPWQRQLALQAIALNLVGILADMASLAAPLSGNEMIELLDEQRLTLDVAAASIFDQPDLAVDTIMEVVGEGMGKALAKFAEVQIKHEVRRRAIRKFSLLALRSAGRVLTFWSAPLSISTRLGGLNHNVSPRESGYASFNPADVLFIQWPSSAGGNGHFYGVTEGSMSWQAAENQAVMLGGHLASITSAAEQTFIERTFLVGEPAMRPLWIGLTDRSAEGTFTWVSGEPVSVTKWKSGEPNDLSDDEDYVAMNWERGRGGPLGTWNDCPVDGTTGEFGPGTGGPYVGLIELNQAVEPRVLSSQGGATGRQ